MQWATVERSGAEKAYVVATEGGNQQLIPGTVVQYDITATDSDQGVLVSIVTLAVNATTGIKAPVAGVVDSTINTNDVGRLQVHGPCTVRASAALHTQRLAVATSAGVAPTGVVTADVQTTTTTAMYARAGIGVCLENVNATQARVQLDIL